MQHVVHDNLLPAALGQHHQKHMLRNAQQYEHSHLQQHRHDQRARLYSGNPSAYVQQQAEQDKVHPVGFASRTNRMFGDAHPKGEGWQHSHTTGPGKAQGMRPDYRVAQAGLRSLQHPNLAASGEGSYGWREPLKQHGPTEKQLNGTVL
jgi:hypothetical protein